jgi:hypothetical protein
MGRLMGGAVHILHHHLQETSPEGGGEEEFADGALTRLMCWLRGWRAAGVQRSPTTQRAGVVFHGCTEREAKRQLVRYWSTNRDSLGMTLTEFAQRCAILDPRTIVYMEDGAVGHPTPEPRRLIA